MKENMSHSSEVLLDYLLLSIKDGKRYFKSKYIAQDLGMSSKEVGSNMKQLQTRSDDVLKIERWSYCKSTTWHVEALS